MVKNEDPIRHELVQKTNEILKENGSSLEVTASDFVWQHGPNFDWGMKEKEPIQNVPFHSKDGRIIYKKIIDVLFTAPTTYCEKGLRLYLKQERAQNEASQAFDAFCETKHISTGCTSQGIILTNN